MKPFLYLRPSKPNDAVIAVASDPDARFIAGGTNLVDLMKRGIVAPGKLVDINHLPLKKIERKDGFIRIGSLALNSDVAAHRLVREKHPLLSEALIAGASGQLRNMATVGGNMLQQTRCSYFYDTAFPCNKRKPESGCSALEGVNRMHAIFGFDEKKSVKTCISVHPSDMSVALMALDATVLVLNQKGERRIPFADFYRTPGDGLDMDTHLAKGDLILAVEIKDTTYGKHIRYLKVRDRASYAFALVSVAAALDIENNRMKQVRLVMGGVAHKPWRLHEAEKLLTGQPVSESIFNKAAEVAMRDAVVSEHSAYKIKLGLNVIVHALKRAADLPEV